MPHYLDHHHPLVRTGSRVQAVNGIRSNTYSRIKSEREIRSPDIIVDSLRHRYDVLTGIVAALIGIGVEFNNATVLAPYIHGLAGDKAMEYVSKTSMMATDIIEGIKILFKGMR